MPSTKKLALHAIAVSLVFSSARTAGATIDVYPRQGAPNDAVVTPQGPGVIVMGGNFDVDDAFVWMHDTLTGGTPGVAGDIVILRDPDPHVGKDDAYPAYLLRLAKFNSAQTIVLSGTLSPSEVAQAVGIVDHAEAVFFGGGDQRDYVGWKGPLLDAVQRVYQRGGVVGGTSAGSVLWGAHVLDAIGEHFHGSVTSSTALADPQEPSITFTSNLFSIPMLGAVVTDSHFKKRDRFGRLAVFVARLAAEGAGTPRVVGVGVEEDNALCIDRNGVATLRQYTAGKGGAWILEGGPPKTLTARRPFVYSLMATRLDAPGASYDFGRGCGGTASYPVAIDANAASPYSPSDPYGGTGGPEPCSTPPLADAGADADADADRPEPGENAGPHPPGSDASVDIAASPTPAVGGCGCESARNAGAPAPLLALPIFLWALALRRSRRTA